MADTTGMSPIRIAFVALFATLALGFAVKSVPAKDWREGVAGFFLTLGAAYGAIWIAANG